MDGDGVSETPAGPGSTFDERHPAGPPPVPRAARVLRAVAVVAVVIAALVGVVGIWRAQTGPVNDRKLDEKRAHERAYSQLAGDPAGPGAARVENITVTDARILRASSSASGTFVLTVYNTGAADRLRSVTVSVDGVAVPRVLYAAEVGAEPKPLPAAGLPLGTGEKVEFTPAGRSFTLLGLPSTATGRRAEVTLGFTSATTVRFGAPVQRAT
jgi:copper(I)-binding protein